MALGVVLAVWTLAAGPNPAYAQTDPSVPSELAIPETPVIPAIPAALGEPFETWTQTANQARSLIEGGNATPWTLERLRNRLDAQRKEAFEAARTGDIQLRALEAQLAALGPVPSDGSPELAVIAERRAALLSEIGLASLPIVAASEAFERANVLITALDKLLLERRAEDLLTRYPTVLLATEWPSAIRELSQWVTNIGYELRGALANDPTQSRIRQALPAILLLSVGGIALLLFAHPLVARRLDAIQASHNATHGEESPRSTAVTLGTGFARLVLPALALAGLFTAWHLFGLTTPSLEPLQGVGVPVAIDLLLAVWLGRVLFSPTYAPHRLISVDDATALKGRRLVLAMGVVSALEIITTAFDQFRQFSPQTISVITAPVMVMGSALFWSLGRILQRGLGTDRSAPISEDTTASSPGETSVASGFQRYLSLALRLLGAAILVSVLLGYVRLSRELFDALMETLAILALALVLYHVVVQTVGLLLDHGQAKGRGAEAAPGTQAAPNRSKTLLPIIIVVLIVIGITPLLALIWGARPSDIAEVWRLLTSGVQIGDVELSIDSLLTLIFVFLLGLVATQWLQKTLRQEVLPRTRIDAGARNAVVTGIGYLGVTLATLLGLSLAGVNLSSLAIVAGALSVGIGFGLQTIVANFVSGIILLVERPIKHGDWIEVLGYSGYVRKISVRSTRIETFDRQDVIIPNAELISGTVTNMTLTDKVGRVIVPVGIAYGSDIEQAKQIMLNAAKNHAEVLKVPAPGVLFMNLGDSALEFELRCFLRDVDRILGVRSDLLTSIYQGLCDAEISIPFPQRDVNLRYMEQIAPSPVPSPSVSD